MFELQLVTMYCFFLFLLTLCTTDDESFNEEFHKGQQVDRRLSPGRKVVQEVIVDETLVSRAVFESEVPDPGAEGKLGNLGDGDQEWRGERMRVVEVHETVNERVQEDTHFHHARKIVHREIKPKSCGVMEQV